MGASHPFPVRSPHVSFLAQSPCFRRPLAPEPPSPDLSASGRSPHDRRAHARHSCGRAQHRNRNSHRQGPLPRGGGQSRVQRAEGALWQEAHERGVRDTYPHVHHGPCAPPPHHDLPGPRSARCFGTRRDVASRVAASAPCSFSSARCLPGRRADSCFYGNAILSRI